jgi:hypothetical protein
MIQEECEPTFALENFFFFVFEFLQEKERRRIEEAVTV